ncbi:MAG: hypothetical protein AB7G21_14060 [Dehalococcoidia bacterium]
MTEDPSAALREQAREWGRALIGAAPWADVADRVTLLVTAPPTGLDAAPGSVALLLAIDTPTARALPAEYRALPTDEAIVERRRATASMPAVSLTLVTDNALDRLLQALTRRAMEARWQVRHSEVVTDRLHRAENFALRAGMLPDDGPERVLRGLWVEAQAAARAFPAIGGSRGVDALPAAGELVAALCRIACFVDDGAYPATEWLLPAARPTRIGKRIGAWIDGIAPALGGDEAAARRVGSSTEQVMHEVHGILAERYRSRPWLAEPEAFTLRAPR